MSPSPSVSIKTVTILSLDSGLGSSQSAFLSNFNRMVEDAILIVGIQRVKDFLSILRTNLRPWLNLLRLGVKDASAER